MSPEHTHVMPIRISIIQRFGIFMLNVHLPLIAAQGLSATRSSRCYCHCFCLRGSAECVIGGRLQPSAKLSLQLVNRAAPEFGLSRDRILRVSPLSSCKALRRYRVVAEDMFSLHLGIRSLSLASDVGSPRLPPCSAPGP